jgi:hypothetical protein
LLAAAIVVRRDATAAPNHGEVATGPSGWYVALGAPRPPAGDAEKTSCGLILTAKSLGISHPVLPCGAKVLIKYGDTTVLTEVIDNDLTSSGRQLELTDALAKLIGLDGTQELRWRYASSN